MPPPPAAAGRSAIAAAGPAEVQFPPEEDGIAAPLPAEGNGAGEGVELGGPLAVQAAVVDAADGGGARRFADLFG